MKHGVGLALLFFVLLNLFSSAGWAETEDVLVYFRGEEIKLALSNENGRFYGLHQEMINLVPELCGSGDANRECQANEWVPLRWFWEALGFQVKWLAELNAVIISENTKSYSLLPEVLAVTEQAVADVDWLKLKTEQALRAHLGRYYTPEAIERVLQDTLDFVSVETDWHSLWKLLEAEVVDAGDGWCLLKVTISETVEPNSEPMIIPGLIKLDQLEAGWRIDTYHYFAD